MEESKLSIKDEIQDPLYVSTSSIEIKTENFDENIDYGFHGIEMPNFVECDVNAYLNFSDNKEQANNIIEKKIDSSDDYSSSDSSSGEETHKKKPKKKKPVNRGKKEWKCSFCDKVYCSKEYKKKHELLHARGKIIEKPVYKCSFCEKVCKRRHDKINHERSHTGEKPYNCSMCAKSFSTSSSVLKHERIHTGEKPFKWIKDPKTKVLIKKETVNVPQVCEECDKSFKTKYELKQHMRSHTGERPYSCTCCDKTFIQITHLRDHIKKQGGARPYKCSFCGKDFALSSSFLKHERAHKKKAEKLLLPYRCKTCDDCGYATKLELLRHDQTVHADETATNFIDKQNPSHYKNLIARQNKKAKKELNELI